MTIEVVWASKHMEVANSMDNNEQDEEDGAACQSNAICGIDLKILVAENRFQDLQDDRNPQMDGRVTIRLHIDDEHTRIVVITIDAPIGRYILTPRLVVGVQATKVLARWSRLWRCRCSSC